MGSCKLKTTHSLRTSPISTWDKAGAKCKVVLGAFHTTQRQCTELFGAALSTSSGLRNQVSIEDAFAISRTVHRVITLLTLPSLRLEASQEAVWEEEEKEKEEEEEEEEEKESRQGQLAAEEGAGYHKTTPDTKKTATQVQHKKETRPLYFNFASGYETRL
ncbi:hypothetical protein E2C01_028008 [Portunus trituberculatus]|uniref:Uncharacterized protein n=1 Tax=Portunus trituberculatus TaxID=210409 RepID=A0A5B7EJJ8_PORTR|nr:hypothetical protein [Portunus trituberculatus]